MKSFALATGSKGNCFYIESSYGIKILVDLGLSFKKTKDILESKNINIEDIDYVFITHEHADHARGISNFAKQIKSKFYMSLGTYNKLGIKLKNIEFVRNHDVLSIEDLKIFIISKPHDSLEAVSYVFENGSKLGIFTDLGYVSDEIKHILKTLDIIYFESSYCDDIISNRDLRYMYVNRLVSDVGHMNTKDSAKVLCEICNSNQKIILSHISKNANTYENAYVKIKKAIEKCNIFPEILVSFDNEPTDWIE